MKWLIDLQRTIWSRDIEVRIGTRDDDGRVSVMQPAIMQSLTDDQAAQFVPPCMSIPIEAAQALMDELWHVGLRPSEGTGSAGSLAATERHLADMKAIAFHALNISKE